MTWTPGSLTDRLGGDERLAVELIQIFLTEYPSLLDVIRASVDRGDATGVRRSAHALRGAVANFVDDGPTATALALERAAGESHPGDMVALAGQLEREVETLAELMRRFRGVDPCAS